MVPVGTCRAAVSAKVDHAAESASRDQHPAQCGPSGAERRRRVDAGCSNPSSSGTGIADSTRRALRIELAAGLLQETAYADARDLLDQARPQPGDPMHRTWLHKTVMAYRRLGEQSADPAMQRQYWGIAKMHLAQAEEAGYHDSETYGIWGGLLKRQLQSQRGGMDEAVAQTLFAEMERNYRLGFQLDPDYYTGVNLLMALRWSGRPKDDVFRTESGETLTVSRFLARRALSEDPADFWTMVTLAELTLHEVFENRAPIDPGGTAVCRGCTFRPARRDRKHTVPARVPADMRGSRRRHRKSACRAWPGPLTVVDPVPARGA
jgi:hypothetical protein